MENSPTWILQQRTRKKLHLAVNEANVKNSQIGGDLLGELNNIDQITGEGAYESENCYKEAEKRRTIPVFAPNTKAVIHQHGNSNANHLTREGLNKIYL